ncbi:MAG: hypothetical protein QF521_18885 [Alphaproteobacteria bacterium]|jgi:hypothetical protein|nr:hypothetical protein [Alphaproteobacteria bacterium]
MRKLLFAALALPIMAAFAPAYGAPQMMGLVASNTAQPIQCQRGHCFAEFTAFCLQPERASPVRGTAYRMHDGSRLTAMATTKDGRRIKLNVERDLQIKAERSHVAVRIGMSAREMARLGLRQVHIKVARNATLVPISMQGDNSPLQPDEIAAGAGPMREFGAKHVDREQHWMPVARLANQMINALPPGGRASDQQRQSLWSRVVGATDFTRAPSGTKERLRSVHDQCQEAVAKGRLSSLRRCLEGKHDSMVGTLNNRYWHAIKTGS